MSSINGLENESVKTTEKKKLSGGKPRPKDLKENEIKGEQLTTLDERSKSIAKESAKLKKKIRRKKIKKENYVAPEFNPFFILVTSLVYMVSADGKIENTEIQLLQNVTGADKTIIDVALRYTQNIKSEVFLSQMPSLLKTKEKICILLNILDLMLIDGGSSEEELNFFFGLQEAFGLTNEVMKPFLTLLKLKNNKRILGTYNEEIALRSLSPHFIFSSAMIYMLTADGVVNDNEVRRLQSSIDEFKGLYEASQKYTRVNRVESFFWDIHGKISNQQAVFILINLFDLLCTDGEIEEHEKELFNRFLSAFKYEENKFKPFSNLIKLKNKKLRTTFKEENNDSEVNDDDESNDSNAKKSKTSDDHHLRELTDEEKMLLLEKEKAKQAASQNYETGSKNKQTGESFIGSSKDINKDDHLRELTLEEQKLLDKTKAEDTTFEINKKPLNSVFNSEFTESKGIKEIAQSVSIATHASSVQQANSGQDISNIQDVNDLEKKISSPITDNNGLDKSQNSSQQIPIGSISEKNQSLTSLQEKENIQTSQEQTPKINYAEITNSAPLANIQEALDKELLATKKSIDVELANSKTSNLQQVTAVDNETNLQTLENSNSQSNHQLAEQIKDQSNQQTLENSNLQSNHQLAEQIKDQSNQQTLLENDSTGPNRRPLDQKVAVGTQDSELNDSVKVSSNTQLGEDEDLSNQKISLELDLQIKTNNQPIEVPQASSNSTAIDLGQLLNDEAYEEPKVSPFLDRVNAIHSQIDTIQQKLDVVEGSIPIKDSVNVESIKPSSKVQIDKDEKIITPPSLNNLEKKSKNSLLLDTSNLEDITAEELEELNELASFDDAPNNLLKNEEDEGIKPISRNKVTNQEDPFNDHLLNKSLDKDQLNNGAEVTEKKPKILNTNIPGDVLPANNKVEISLDQDKENKQPTAKKKVKNNQLQIHEENGPSPPVFNDLNVFANNRQESILSARESEVLNSIEIEPKTLAIFIQPDELILNAKSTIRTFKKSDVEHLFHQLIIDEKNTLESTEGERILDKTKINYIKLRDSKVLNPLGAQDKELYIKKQFKLNIIKVSFAFILFSLWSLDTTAPCGEESCERKQVGAPLRVETLPPHLIKNMIAIVSAKSVNKS